MRIARVGNANDSNNNDDNNNNNNVVVIIIIIIVIGIIVFTVVGPELRGHCCACR